MDDTNNKQMMKKERPKDRIKYQKEWF